MLSPAKIGKNALLKLALVCLCAFAFGADAGKPQGQQTEHARVHAEMRNIFYHYTDSIAVHIIRLQGDLAPIGEAGMPIFDDANSFRLEIESAQITVGTDALTNVLNQYAFAASDAPMKGIRVSARNGRIHIKGHLHAGDVPFESEGTLSVTSEGDIRVHTEKIKAVHVPIKGLMDAVGESIAKLIDTGKTRGVRAEKDDLILSPSALFPPPHIVGRLSGISIQGSQIVLQYGGTPAASLKITGNYMAYRGARLRFGKLTMNDTDLTLVDMNPEDPFDFSLAHYREQLAAGYTKITVGFALKSYFRDYNKLVRRGSRR